MPDIGDLAKAINAQNVKLKIGLDEVIVIYNTELGKDTPINRVGTRSGAADFFQFQVIDLMFESVVTEAVYQTLNTLNTMTSRGALPLQAFTLTGENLGGAAGDDLVITFSGSITLLRSTAPQAGAYAVRCNIRIKNSTFAVGA